MSRKETAALHGLVARHFSEPEWFTTFEFPLYGAVETADGKDRSLDALVVSRIAGRGNEVHGVETKSDRADWLKELNTPLKAEAWTRLLDRFWLVAAKDVAKVEEVPVGWGFLEANGSGLRVVRRAPPLEVTQRLREAGGEPIPREVWVRILRRTLDHTGISPLLQASFTRGHKAGVESVTDKDRREVEHAQGELERFQRALAEFEKASGVKIDGWGGQRLGEAVRVVMETKDFVRSAGNLTHNVRRHLKDLDEALAAAGFKEEEEVPL